MFHTVLKISDLLRPELIIELPEAGKNEVLSLLCRAASHDSRVKDAEAFYRALLHRETQASTGIGMGLAIPHAKIAEISDNVIIIGRSRAGIDFKAVDGAPVHLIFLIGASDHQTREFVRLLAAVTHILKNEPFRANLLKAAIPDEFIALLRAQESGS